MAELVPSSLKLINQNARTVYDNAITKARTPLMDSGLVEITTSQTKEELYAYLDRIPNLVEWIGPRKRASFAALVKSIKNKKFQAAVEVEREDIEDDKFGLYRQQFSRIGMASRRWPEIQVRNALQSGKAEQSFDGRNFFATNHYVNAAQQTGSQANLFTAKPLNRDNFVSVWQSMLALVGGDGEPLDDFEDLVLIVEPSNADMAKQICESPLSVLVGAAANTFGAITNPSAGVARPLVVPALANKASEVGVWYLASASGESPFIFQLRTAPDLVPRVNPEDPDVWEKDKLAWGVRARGRAALGLWWKCARVEPT